MAVQFPNFLNAQILKPDYSGIGDALQNVLAGYEGAQRPQQLRDEAESRKYDNMVKAIQAEFARPTAEAGLELTKTQIDKAKNPPLTGELGQLFALRQRFPEGTKEREWIESVIQNKAAGSAGTQFGFNPETGEFTFTQGGVAQGNKKFAGLPELKKGENYVYDPESHAPIGISRSLTPAETKEEAGRNFFNTIYPEINRGLSEYSSGDAYGKFVQDIYNYNKDPEAKTRVDDYLLAKKLLSAGVVKENATLGGANTNRSYQQLRDTLDSSVLNKHFEQILKTIGVSSEANKIVGDRFQDILNSAQEKASTSVPAQRINYFNPQSRAAGQIGGKPYSDADIKATAKKYNLSESEVRRRLKEHQQRNG